MPATAHLLSGPWYWKQFDGDDLDNFKISDFKLGGEDIKASWSPCTSFPSEIHVELTKAGKIPNPIQGFNEHLTQWVADEDWLYATTFSVAHLDEVFCGSRIADLQFDGLDTFCAVYLNGNVVLQTDNMFLSYSAILSPRYISQNNDNLLVLRFSSAKNIAKDLEAEYDAAHTGSCDVGDPSRVYVRKTQYQWRWDWGPELLSAGPYRPITIRTYINHLASVTTHACVSDDLKFSFALDISLSSANGSNIQDGTLRVHVTLRDSKGTVVKEEWMKVHSVDAGTEIKDFVDWILEKDEVALWWPVGYGDQVLYEVEIVLMDAKTLVVIDTVKRKIGFRHVELVQEPLMDAPGTSFFFKVNGVSMFMGGSNWVPGDSLLTTMTRQRYRAWLQLLRDGNQNMIRVWGGGIYEDDAFYDACDELGLLIWQDFQMTCGIYPGKDDFPESFQAEAEDNIRRLRHHPSLVLFCGGNENYQQIRQRNLNGELPATTIHEEIFPEAVKTLTNPEIPYWIDSPYGGQGWDTADQTVGDVHSWDIWAGKGDPYQDYDLRGGRFVSEFGVPALPCVKTVDTCFPLGESDEQKLKHHLQSKVLQQLSKAGSHEGRFAALMNENFKMGCDLETFVYLTQLMQSEALAYAYRVWRREWRGEGKEYNGGALVWQGNDCWPVTSCSIVDYYLRPKLAYFAIARELRQYTVGIQRLVTKDTNDRPRQFYEFGSTQSISATIDVWATNSTLKGRNVQVVLRAFDLQSTWTYTNKGDIIVLQPNSSTEIHRNLPCPHPGDDATVPTPSHSVVVAASIVDVSTREVLAKTVDWPQPYKLLNPPSPGFKTELDAVTTDGTQVIKLTADRPVKGVLLSVEGGEDDVRWTENGFDVIPGHTERIVVHGLRGRPLRVAYLGAEKAQALAT